MGIGLVYSLIEEVVWGRLWGFSRGVGNYGKFLGFLFFDFYEGVWKEIVKRY